MAQGDYAAAETLYRRALAGQEQALGPAHPDTLYSVSKIAGLLKAQDNYAAAEPLYRRALVGFEQALGPDHPNSLGSVNNLAGLLNSQGDYAAAEPLYRRALAGCEQALGPDHPDTADQRQQLGHAALPPRRLRRLRNAVPPDAARSGGDQPR